MLVSTHYMDEAERCHKLAYIAYGRLLAQGTAREVIASQGLTTFAVRGADLTALAERAARVPGVEQTAAFGETLHVTGKDARAARASLREATAGRRVPDRSPSTPGLEDVFIHLMQGAADNLAMPAKRERSVAIATDVATRERLVLASQRWWAMVGKEFLQLRRDRVTFAMIVGIPIIQLTLFGFAINTDPKHLPTALIAADHSEFTRTFVAAMRDVRLLRLRRRAAGRGGGPRGARARRRRSSS